MPETRTLEWTHFCAKCGNRTSGAGECERDGATFRPIPVHGVLGRTVGNYVLVERIGEGGMGAVYRAVQPAIGANVAIKLLHAAGDAVTLQRALVEAQAVNRIRDSGVVRILDVGELDAGRPYLVMEWLDGIALADAMKASRLPLGAACAIVADVLDTLALAHAEGVIHRDLKPHNIYLCTDGRIVVLDFGIAKLVGDNAPQITRSGGLMGTPNYMAPEQIQHQPIDGRTDLYAMAIVLFELATGHRPFDGDVTFDVLRQQLEAAPPRANVPGVPPALERLIARGLAKVPSDRFANAPEMADAVRAAAHGLVDPGVVSVVANARSQIADGRRAEPATHREAHREEPATRPHDGRAEPSPAAPSARGRRVWLATAAASLVAAGGVVGWQLVREQNHAQTIDAGLDVGVDAGFDTDIDATLADAIELMEADASVMIALDAKPPRRDAAVIDAGVKLAAPTDAAIPSGNDTQRKNEDGDTVACHGKGITEVCDDPEGEWRTDGSGKRVRCRGRACFAQFNTIQVAATTASDTELAGARTTGHGETQFRADRWLARAEQAARAVAGDAVLTRMMTTIGPGGVSPNGQGTYELRSPSHAGKLLRVIVSTATTEVLVLDDARPNAYVRHPRCTLDALWARLVREEWPSASKIFVDYSGGAWEVGEAGDRRIVKDYCP